MGKNKKKQSGKSNTIQQNGSLAEHKLKTKQEEGEGVKEEEIENKEEEEEEAGDAIKDGVETLSMEERDTSDKDESKQKQTLQNSHSSTNPLLNDQTISQTETNGSIEVNDNNNTKESEVEMDRATAAKLKQVEQERDEIQQSYDSLVSRLSSMKTVFGKMKQSELELEEKSELVQNLSSENEELKAKLQQMQETHEQTLANKVDDTVVAQLRDENHNLNFEIQKLNETLNKTRREYASTIDELQDEKYNLENQTSKLNKKIHELKQEISELNASRAEADVEYKENKAIQEDLKTKLISKEEELRISTNIILQLESNIRKSEEQIKSIESLCNEKITAIEKQNQMQVSSIEDLQAEVKEYKEKLALAESENKQLDELKSELNNKQLLIGKLRHEAIILNEHLTKALTMLKQGGDSSNKLVDRELISNVIISFLQFPRGDSKKFEALQLISALLEWDSLQKIAAGLQHVPNPKNQTKLDANGNEVPVRQSFVSLWTEYLEKESSKK